MFQQGLADKCSKVEKKQKTNYIILLAHSTQQRSIHIQNGEVLKQNYPVRKNVCVFINILPNH